MNQQHFFENFILGVTQSEVEIEERDMNIAATHKLVSSASTKINIMSRDLDHKVYNQPDIITAFKQFANRGRHAETRILLFDSTNIIKRSHRLITLANRIPSKIRFRIIAPQSINFNESFITADGKGYLHNLQSDRYEGSVDFNNKTHCAALDKIFTDYWHQSEPLADLRRMSI